MDSGNRRDSIGNERAGFGFIYASYEQRRVERSGSLAGIALPSDDGGFPTVTIIPEPSHELPGPLVCDGCQSPEVICVDPGSDPERWAPGGFVLSAGRPMRCWCRACMPGLGRLHPP